MFIPNDNTRRFITQLGSAVARTTAEQVANAPDDVNALEVACVAWAMLTVKFCDRLQISVPDVLATARDILNEGRQMTLRLN